MPAIIEIENLTKRYGLRTAVEGLSLTVQQGDIFGFVGPNGAGKTTTIRILTTLMKPNSGEARVGGYSAIRHPQQVRKLIGYMPDFFGVYNDLKVWEYLDFFANCYRVPQEQRPALINDLLELVDLTHRRDDFVDNLSRGMKQRLSLARTLVHDPQVIVLDEPASGLDPRARIEIRELMLALANMGKTIFFSTHILADVAQICSRVCIIEAGKLVVSGPIETLRQQLVAQRQLEITLLGEDEQAARDLLSKTPGIGSIQSKHSSNEEKARVTFQVEFSGDDAATAALLQTLIQHNLPVLRFNENTRDLEDVFLRATKGIVS